jgi:hypothetical protein
VVCAASGREGAAQAADEALRTVVGRGGLGAGRVARGIDDLLTGHARGLREEGTLEAEGLRELGTVRVRVQQGTGAGMASAALIQAVMAVISELSSPSVSWSSICPFRRWNHISCTSSSRSVASSKTSRASGTAVKTSSTVSSSRRRSASASTSRRTGLRRL